VKDFQIHLTVKEERPIVGLKVDVPIIGQISGENIEVNDREVKIVFNMSEVEQVLFQPFLSNCTCI
jgi:hypothetical protein